ncbi:type I-E CRISPR-associated protein Cas6/Cse3/CasE [Streptosporangium sp. NPDC020072]|uniref:type I-E CRISPR-associated protein Cas6/Cse3/CasE n=1 Tax=Streptosporangium sp. NPDC020072 TaxID=3154788 RepID=UPI00343B0EF8
MFLTKLTINPQSSAFRRDTSDVHDMHRTVMSAYPELPPTTVYRSTHGVLWRVDELPGGRIVQYVQSQTAPDWSHLSEGVLLRPAEVRPLQPLLESIRPGRKLTFRLMANPTRCVQRRRIPLRQPAEQVEWLVGKGERHGFVVPVNRQGTPDVVPTPAPRLVGKKRKAQRIIIDPVRYDGHLVVTDLDAFTAALVNGVGRAKAYGCGLLSLAPARSIPS